MQIIVYEVSHPLTGRRCSFLSRLGCVNHIIYIADLIVAEFYCIISHSKSQVGISTPLPPPSAVWALCARWGKDPVIINSLSRFRKRELRLLHR